MNNGWLYIDKNIGFKKSPPLKSWWSLTYGQVYILINRTQLLSLPISDIKIAHVIMLAYNLQQIHVYICKCKVMT